MWGVDKSFRPDPPVLVDPISQNSFMAIPEKALTAQEAAGWAAHCKVIDWIAENGPLPGLWGDHR